MEEAYYKLMNDIVRGYDRCTPDKIVSLRPNQIFVFGTNKLGSQKSGAAGLAAKSFGAKVGVIDGPTGNCYALPTMGFSVDELAKAVVRFEQYVRANLNNTYLVTAVGCGHAGFDVTQVANMFKGLLGLRNVMLPEAFIKVYRKECNDFFSKTQVKAPVVEKTVKEEKEPKEIKNDKYDEILSFFDESVHDVVRYLIANNIPFNHEGGFSLQDERGRVIAEAELGIENEKVVFSPFNSQSVACFKNNGYTVCSPQEYLSKKGLDGNKAK